MAGASDFLIRVASPADADAVSAVLAASYTSLLAGHYESGALSRALPYMTRANPMLLASGTYYVAESQAGEIAGCGGWTAARPGTGEIAQGEAHIRHVATHPAWAKRGVGALLMGRCFDEARQHGVRKLHCFSTLNAVAFYRACGFETVGPIEVALVPNLTLPSVPMSRAL
jgi:GNAT superfamily N-acetyltransferase